MGRRGTRLGENVGESCVVREQIARVKRKVRNWRERREMEGGKEFSVSLRGGACRQDNVATVR